MPDAPDWYKYQPGSERHIIGDLAEQAARLWSPDTYDRRGEVLFMDQFDYGLSNWSQTGENAGDVASIVAGIPYMGGYCAKLLTAGDDPNLIELHKYISPPVVNKWGFEVAMSFPTDWLTFSIELRRIHEGVLTVGYVGILKSTGVLRILDENTGFETIADVSKHIAAANIYHKLKIVGDFSTGLYERVIFNQVEYDLTSYTMDLVSTDDYIYNDLFISFGGVTLETDYCYIGSIIVTANEP